MKTSIQIILFFISAFYTMGQKNSSCITDDEYINSNGFKVTAEYDTILHCYCGYYREYDSLGILRIEGNYKIADSIQCKDCYDGHFSIDSSLRIWTQYHYSKSTSTNLRVGLWKYYHSSGALRMSGNYSDYIHEFQGTTFGPIDNFEWNGTLHSGPINVWIDFEYLKDGVWEYFNESGERTKIEDYIDGTLVYTVSY